MLTWTGGSLSGVALRNVPPHVANYQQRAGRAGRRGRTVASVITFAHGTSHDSHYYRYPADIISGDVRPPIVYIENQQVLKRHINAYLVQRYFHETVTVDGEIYQLFESLGTVEQFLSDAYSCSHGKLKAWLLTNEKKLKEELKTWVPNYSFGLGKDIAVLETIENSMERLVTVLDNKLPVENYAHREELEGVVREGLERQLEEKLLDFLINRAIFPRYAFPTDVVGFWVSKPRYGGEHTYKRVYDYEPQRDLTIALSEYAPGSSLTIDKYRFTSAAIYSPYEPEVRTTLERAQAYVSCNSCGFVSLQETMETEPVCPNCHSDQIDRRRFLIPQGFATDINARKEIDRGESPVFTGRTTRAQLEVQDPPSTWDEHLYQNRLSVISRSQNLVLVNKGVGNRGFMICPNCGRSEAVFGPGYPRSIMLRGGVPRQHQHPLEEGAICNGHAVGAFYLGHLFPTDVLLLRFNLESPVVCPTSSTPEISGRPGRVALTSLVEAICLSASQTLQIDEGELSGNWSPVLGGGHSSVNIFLYDLLPGGAGYTRQVKMCLEEVLENTENLLSNCNCEVSCYNCIRHYGNNFLHASLDRHMALSLLRYIKYGAQPELENEYKMKAAGPLYELLRLRGFHVEKSVQKNGISVPLVVERKDTSEVWIDVHHPLVDEENSDSEIRKLSEEEFVEFSSIDAFTLRYDLPSALSQLQI